MRFHRNLGTKNLYISRYQNSGTFSRMVKTLVRKMVLVSPGNGLGLIQIQLDFFTWILMDLDLIGYGYPIALDSIGLDFVG